MELVANIGLLNPTITSSTERRLKRWERGRRIAREVTEMGLALTPAILGVTASILLRDTTLFHNAHLTFVDTQAHNVNYNPNFKPGPDFYTTQSTTNIDFSWLNTIAKFTPGIVGIAIAGFNAWRGR